MNSPPTGTITFLFTDIEGSTKLWEAHPDAMRLALARHDALLRESIELHSGHVFKTMGDAFCAAFHTAPDALNAAIATQQALQAEPWPEETLIKVRMALHTGAAEMRDNDYFGPPLNRVARLLSVAHGGQVLISDVAHDLCRDSLPPAVSLMSLGEHRLPDLSRPEIAFQLLHHSLRSEFPPLKSLDNPELPNNLPLNLTSFIGRDKEIGELKNMLSKTRLLTLMGSGGCGKTRLAMQAAADVLDQFPAGVWLVELAALADPALVLQSVASVFEVREEGDRKLNQTLTSYLKSKNLLLILDNCEHVLDSCSALADSLLRSCPNVRILATSREALGVPGEQRYRVPPLSLPNPKKLPSLEALNQYEAVALFIERARLVNPAFVVTDANAPALAQICYWLDGMPLAIELAAARARSLPLEQIVALLGDRFRILTGGSRTLLPRQQTLRALIDWSYDLLSEPERQVLRRLSVFMGGCTLAATEAVCAHEGESGRRREGETAATASSASHYPLPSTLYPLDILDLLTSLEDKSLVIAEDQNGSVRYRMLETIRQYGREKLVHAGEADEIEASHARYFVALGEEIAPKLEEVNGWRWMDQLEIEHDNLRAALEWCVGNGIKDDSGLRLAAALSEFWNQRGHLTEGRTSLDRVFEKSPALATKSYAAALFAAAELASSQWDHNRAHALCETSLAVYRDLCDINGITLSLGKMGWISHMQGDNTSARTLFTEAVSIAQGTSNRGACAKAYSGLGRFEAGVGDYAAGRRWLDQELTIAQELNDERHIFESLESLAIIDLNEGNFKASRERTEEILVRERVRGNKQGIAWSLFFLGVCSKACEDTFFSAHKYFEDSRAIYREINDKMGVGMTLDWQSHLVAHEGDYARALSMHAERLAIYEERGDRRGTADVLFKMGVIMQDQSCFEAADRYYDEALAILSDISDNAGIIRVLNCKSDLANLQGEHDVANAMLSKSLELCVEIDIAIQTAPTLALLGRTAINRGDLLSARSFLEERLQILQAADWSKRMDASVAAALGDMGYLSFNEGDYHQAADLYRQSLELWRKSSDPDDSASTLVMLCLLSNSPRSADRTSTLDGAVTALRGDFNRVLRGIERKEYDEHILQARGLLGVEAFTAAQERGRAMNWEQAIVYALAELEDA